MVHRTLLQLAEAVTRAAPKPRLRKAAVEITEAAIGRIKSLLENREKVTDRHSRSHFSPFIFSLCGLSVN